MEELDLKRTMSPDDLSKVIVYINKYFSGNDDLIDQLENLKKLIKFLSVSELILGEIESDLILDKCPKIVIMIRQILESKDKSIIEMLDEEEVNSLLGAYNTSIYVSLEEVENFDYSNVKDFDIVKLYLNEIGKYRLLTFEEEQELGKIIKDANDALSSYDISEFKSLELDALTRLLSEYKTKYADGDKSVEEKIFILTKLVEKEKTKKKLSIHNLRLVVSTAKSCCKDFRNFGDAIQDGNIGLMTACEKYDYTMGYKFSTYATWWIKQSITRAFADNGRNIRIPVHAYERMNKIKRFMSAYEMANNGVTPSASLIAEKLSMNIDTVLELMKYLNDTVSIHNTVGEDGDTELVEFIEDEQNSGENFVDSVYIEQFRNAIFSSPLEDRELFILCARFGVKYRGDRFSKEQCAYLNGVPKTLEEVGKFLNVTRERVRQVEAKALRKLRNNNNIKKFNLELK